MWYLEAWRDLGWERAFNPEYRDFIVKGLIHLQERPVKEQETTVVEWFTAMRKCKLSGKLDIDELLQPLRYPEAEGDPKPWCGTGIMAVSQLVIFIIPELWTVLWKKAVLCARFWDYSTFIFQLGWPVISGSPIYKLGSLGSPAGQV